jgi:hypothetical protein
MQALLRCVANLEADLTCRAIERRVVVVATLARDVVVSATHSMTRRVVMPSVATMTRTATTNAFTATTTAVCSVR